MRPEFYKLTLTLEDRRRGKKRKPPWPLAGAGLDKEKKLSSQWGSFGVVSIRIENNFEMYHLELGGLLVSVKLGCSDNESENSHQSYLCWNLMNIKQQACKIPSTFFSQPSFVFQPTWQWDSSPWPVSAVVCPYNCQFHVPWEMQPRDRTLLPCAAQTQDKTISGLKVLFSNFNLLVYLVQVTVTHPPVGRNQECYNLKWVLILNTRKLINHPNESYEYFSNIFIIP